MAYQLTMQFTEVIRQSPLRAALACVLLITTSVYVCVGQDGYRVAEIGEADSSESAIDLTSYDGPGEGIDQVSTDEEDAPAVATRVGSREQYIDAQLTHALVEEDVSAISHRIRVTPVSGESKQGATDGSPVWLLGVLIDE